MKQKLILLVALVLALLISPVSAVIDVTANQTTSSSIIWQWDTGLTITSMYIDGYKVTEFNPTGGIFILTGLNPSEQHNIVIATAGDSGSNITRTLSQTLALNTDTSTDIYIWAFAGLVGLILFLLSLRPSHSGDEIIINTIISVFAWLPIGFCAYSSFNVSRVTSTGYLTLYSYGTIGILMYAFLAVAILNTVRLIALHRVFSGSDQE
jgi:uncharacterized protein involved in response to NO